MQDFIFILRQVTVRYCQFLELRLSGFREANRQQQRGRRETQETLAQTVVRVSKTDEVSLRTCAHSKLQPYYSKPQKMVHL